MTKIYNGFKAIEEYIEYEEKLVDAVVAFGVDSEPFDALFYVEPGKIDFIYKQYSLSSRLLQ